MRVFAVAGSPVFVLLLAAAGCASNPIALQQQNKTLQQQQVALEQRNRELQSRATTLDRDNQELETLLAQSRQQTKVLDDQLAAVRDQLGTVNTQLAQVRNDKQLTEKQTEALMASARRRGGAQITANNSLQRGLPSLSLPGVEVRPDGDVVRVELPASKLFPPNSASLQPVAAPFVDSVAAELNRVFPEQKIGVEGHTDGDVVRNTLNLDNQQISVARATAVYQYLVSHGVPAYKLFIVGHGATQPVVSNATAAGKARNARVELVVYPDKAVR